MIRERLTPIWRSEELHPHPAEGGLGPYIVLSVATAAFALVFSWLSVARHAAFQSHAFDLGNMDQAVWNTLHGRPLRFTDMEVGHIVLTSRLAIHVEPLLLLFAPLYLVHSGPETLLVSQAVVAATGAIPAYLLARVALGRVWLALAFPLAYLLHPSLQNVLLDDFHAVALTAALLLWALYFFYRDRPVLFGLFALLSMATKEEVGLVVACLGVWALWRRKWATGLLCLLGGIGWFLICVAVIIPHFNPAGRSPYLLRYAYLGHGLGGIALGAVQHPGLVAHTLLSELRLRYLLDLIHPFGFTPLLAFPVMALVLPVLLINMLSADPTMYSGFYQYSAEIVPAFVAASILGVSWVEQRRLLGRIRAGGWLAPTLCGLVLLASLVDSRVYGFTPLSAGYLVPTTGTHQRLEEHLLSLIPPQAVVAAADEIEPHVSERSWVYVLPTTHPQNGPRAQYLVLDASVPSLPVTPRVLHRVTQTALRSGYGVRAATDGILLLQYGARSRILPRGFFSFMFRQSRQMQGVHASWGPLRLTGMVLHPRSGGTNRSRPGISLETYWRTSRRLPPSARIAFHLSPPYTGQHPRYSSAWTSVTDSPTWDWMPLPRWSIGKQIRADSLSLLPPMGSWGTVDVAVSVSGLGAVHARKGGGTVIAPGVLRVGSVTVRP